MGKHKKVHRTKLPKKQKILRKNGLIVLLILIIIFTVKVFFKPNLAEISLILNNKDITQNLSNKLFNVDNIVYMSFEDISKYIDNTIYLEDENLIITTSNKKVSSLKVDNNIITINGAEKIIAGSPIKVNENIFIPISELESVYDIDFDYYSSSNKAIIDDLSTKKVIATTKKKIAIKEDKNIFSKTLAKVKKEEKVTYIAEEGKWSRVMSKEGYIGYVKTDKLINITTEREEFKIQNNTGKSEYYERDISNEDISNFNKRKELIQDIFTEAIKNDKINIKLFFKEQSIHFERLIIEAIPIFNECGLNCEFVN